MEYGYLLLFIVLRNIACSHVSTRCPVHWLERPEGNSCYRFWPTRIKPWKDARAMCQARDGDLLKLDSKHEKEWIINHIEKYPVDYEWWIGLERHPGNDSIWLWTDGTARNESYNFIQWGSGEPNNHRDSEDCAEIWDNLLNDKNCDQPLQFICERPKDLPMKCDVDNGWDDITSFYCFKYFPDKVTYDEAVSTCKQEDGYLLELHADNEAELITDFLDHKDKPTIWTAYQLDTRSSTWTSVPSTFPVDDKYWKDGVPDPDTVRHNDTLCSVIDTSVDGLNNWRPENCKNSNSFMCYDEQGTCPYGYIKHKTTCYLLNTQDFLTWNEARGFCNLRSTTLLEIKNDNDWYYILKILKDQYSSSEINSVWIGLSGAGEDSLKWDSGVELGDFEKTKSSGKVTQDQNNAWCGFIDGNSKSDTDDGDQWKFGDCSDTRGVICTVSVNKDVTTPPQLKPRYECPEGYQLKGVKCYRWNPDIPIDWYSAREKCVNEGADLATVQTAEDQEILSSFIQSDTWIGLNDRKEEGRFSWLDTTVEVDFQNWLESQPNNVEIGLQYSENCVVMHYLPGEGNHGKWSDYPCTYKAGFVCQTFAEWNIALGKLASQSSIRQLESYTYSSYDYSVDYISVDSDEIADKAIDGCNSRSIQSSKCCSRTDTEDNPWWMVDLGTYYPIGKIVIHRLSGEPSVCSDCISTLRNFRLFISNSSDFSSPDTSNMVYQEQRDRVPAVIVLYLTNVTTGRYVRIDIPRKAAKLEICEVNIYEGRSIQKAVNPANAQCVSDSTKWSGEVRHVISGKTCQRWTLNFPHSHNYHDKTFPDGTEVEAENFCRDPEGEGQPWCYTTDPNVRWEFCAVPHCYTEVGLIDSDVTDEMETDCKYGWEEDPNTGDCYWLSDGELTWSDATSVCKSVEASLSLPTSQEDMNLLTGKLSQQLSNQHNFWLNVYYEVDEESWVSVNDHVPTYVSNKLGSSSPTTTMCLTADQSGNIQAKNCLERNIYSCIKSGPFIKFRTRSDEGYKQLSTSLIEKVTDNSVTTLSVKFEFKGYDGATVLLHQASNTHVNDCYIIKIGGNISPKSTISKSGTDLPKHSAFIPNLCDKDKYKEFWIRWTNGNSDGDSIEVGRGTEVGRNIFMKWTDPAGSTADSVSFATVVKVSAVNEGYWRFQKDMQKKEKAKTIVNLALGKPTMQSSTFAYKSGPEKAVDGCKDDKYNSKCVTHTNLNFEPWWEVDLGKAYPIREVVIYRRGPECCTERLGYFKLIISMLSDSTLEEDVVYKSDQREPPFVMNIPAKGKFGRYVKIYIPDRKEYLELSEVEVYEDLDVSRCGSGWMAYESTASCYKFSEVEMSWKIAKEFCDGFESTMVVPKSPKQQLFLYEVSLPIYDSRTVWLGLHDMNSEGTFVTTDGSPLIYTDWEKDEPNNFHGSENCASLRMDLSSKSGTWNDKNCDVSNRAVCRKSEQTVTTTTTTTSTTATTSTTSTTTTPTVAPETTLPLTQGACDSGWTYSAISSSCLRIFLDPKVTFYKAAAKCLNLNSRLASFKNSLEQNFIGQMLTENNVNGVNWEGIWCAGTDEHIEGQWNWFMDNLQWHSSIKWSPGQPSGALEHCAMIRTASDNFVELNDAPCDSENIVQGYLCKYDLDLKKCKDGWIYNGETDTCYKYVHNSPETWNNAVQKCKDNGGILATIANKPEQLFLKVLISESNIKGVWLGAHDLQEDGLFQWIDGTEWIRGLWAPDQPNNWKGNQNCGMLVVNALPNALGLLQDDFCEDEYPYICAIKGCKSGWEKFEENCYLFSLTNLGWEKAKSFCESEGARLLIVEDEKEHKYVQQKVIEKKASFMWIGARYDSTYGEHRWIDGSEMTVNGWAAGRPGSVKGCVDYLKNVGYLWNSHWDCINTNGPYICEKVRVSAAGLTKPPDNVSSTTSSTVQTTIPMTTSASTLSQTTQAGMCGIGWQKDPSSSTCYKFVIELASWTDAQTKCSEVNGNLLSITSEQEQSYVTGRLQGISMLPAVMWIGASDKAFEAGWKWIDDQPFAYLNWARGEPNYYEVDDGTSEGEDCAVIITGDKELYGQWKDIQCSGKNGYICKKKVDVEEGKTLKPAPDIENTEIIEFYQQSYGRESNFQSHDLFEMGVRPTDNFIFSVKTKRDAHILLQNKKNDFTTDVYLVIIGGWGGTKSTIGTGGEYNHLDLSGLLSQYEYRWFWISWNKTTIAFGKSDQVGTNELLTYSGEISDINYLSVSSAQYTDAHWRIPKGDKYYGCSGVGWLGYRDSCFLIVEESKDWNEANSYCHKEGAELASIKDDQEQRFLFSQFPQDTYCFNAWQNDTECNKWVERGECERNPVWMAKHCHLACKHCFHNCRDKYHSSTKCLEWSRLGECEKNPKWMIPNCAMSCGVCQGAPTRGYWIGLQSSGMDQSYRWSDYKAVKFTIWDSHQPLWFNLRPRSCVAMFIQNGKWNDGQCTDPLSGFICKQSKMVVPFTTKSPFEIGCAMENGYGYGPHCYVYVKEQKSWSDAKENCNSLGGFLAYIDNMYSQAFVASELQNLLQDYWIGLSVSNGNLTWDGKKQSKLTMTHFDKTVKVGELTDGCFAMATYKPVGLWKLYEDCSSKLPSICQIPREGFTTTMSPSTVPSSTSLPECADTWLPYGKYCYKMSDETQQWHVAQQICTHYGSSLISVHDTEENIAVANLAAKRDVFWIGLHDTETEGVFVWEDESPTDFSAWNPYEPNNANDAEDCAELLTWNYHWNDANCYGLKRYICQIPRGKAVNEQPPPMDSFPACNQSNPDDGWVAQGQFCYFLGTDEFLTWHDANKYCRRKGSELTSVHSQQEQQFLSGLNSKSGDVSWLGLNDLDLDNRFSWSDSTGFDFVAWASGQPNDGLGGEKCVTLYGDGTWHDYPCNDLKPYICKRRKDDTGMTTIAPTTQTIDGGCPPGFNYTFGNKCYYFSFDVETVVWGVASDKCDLLGGELISIHSEQEQDFVALNVYGMSSSVWLGMHDLNGDNRFDWTDNSPIDYINWAPNEPSSNAYDTFSKEPCVEMWTDVDNLGLWNDVKCYASRGYTCSSFKDSSLPALDSQCPEGFIFLRYSCYMVLPTKQSWNQSLDSCSLINAQMITFVEASNHLVIKLLISRSGQDEVWIGGTSIEGDVKWNDGSNPLKHVPYSVRTGCLFSTGMSLSSAECSEKRATICEIFQGSSTTTSSVSSIPSTTPSSTIMTTQTYTCRNSSWFLYNGFCYTSTYELTTYTNTKCSKYGMTLASVYSAEENFKIISWILQRQWSNSLGVYPYFWIGLSLQTGDVPVNRWIDGGTLVYSNINKDAGRSKQGCVILMLFTGQWQVVSCADKHFSICKGRADVVTTLPTASTTNLDEANTTKDVLITTTYFKFPQFHHGNGDKKVPDDDGLSGGQIAGVVIGVLGVLLIIGAVLYILKFWAYKKPQYTFEAPSLGFDNALFHKNQDTVDIN